MKSSIALVCVLLYATVSLASQQEDQKLTAYDVLEQYDFPVGLLPKGATGYELDAKTGQFTAYLNGTCSFSIESYELKYKSTIKGVISKDRLAKLKGVSVKVALLWLNIVEVTRNDDELQFSVGIASADFAVNNFLQCPQCGCGFDCNNSRENNGEMKTEDFSSCCADTTFANKMTIASPFSSLEHAITVARDIWSRKLNVRSWLEALSGRSCSNEYLEMANASTVQKLHEWGIKVRGEIWLCFVTFVGGRTFEDILAELKMRFNNSHGVELEIASKEELKYIECAIRELLSKKSVQTIDKGDVSTEYSGEIVADTLDGADTDSEDDLDAISSGGYDISRDVELNRVPKKDNKL